MYELLMTFASYVEAKLVMILYFSPSSYAANYFVLK